MAVGDAHDAAGQIVTLAERWDGMKWTVESTPATSSTGSSYLTGVSCVSANYCVAVGFYAASNGLPLGFAEGWNGRHWKVEHIPQPASAQNTDLVAISCQSTTACTAVGSYQAGPGEEIPDAERWDGSSWTLEKIPAPANAVGTYLDAVSCSAKKECTAVGGFFTPNLNQFTVAEHWDGTKWSEQGTPRVSGPPIKASTLSGVSCPTPTWCTAVGTYLTKGTALQLALVERWNGTAWIKQRTTVPGATFGLLDSVTCRSASLCTATGTVEFGDSDLLPPTVAIWNGHRWTFGPVSKRRGALVITLSGVACVAQWCSVVGTEGTTGFGVIPIAEYATGTVWRVPTVQPALGFTSTAGFGAVSCGSSTSCTTLGTYRKPNGRNVPLIEIRNGTAWTTIDSIAEPALARKYGSYPAPPLVLNGIACSGTKHCIAVGGYVIDNDADYKPLVEVWDGTTWALQKAPTPDGATNSSFNSVSCVSPDACTAVGRYTSGHDKWPFAERWNGTVWTIEIIAKTGLALDADLSSLSCPSATSCVAVGYGVVSLNDVPLSAHWDGHTWTLQQAPEPAGAPGAAFIGVSCPSSQYCIAIGDVFVNEKILTEVWQGADWSVQPLPAWASNQPGFGLTAVSCASNTDCVAVGYSHDPAPTSLAARWNGTTWTMDNPTDPRNTEDAELNAISCPTATACTAVGIYTPPVAQLTRPLADTYQ